MWKLQDFVSLSPTHLAPSLHLRPPLFSHLDIVRHCLGCSPPCLVLSSRKRRLLVLRHQQGETRGTPAPGGRRGRGHNELETPPNTPLIAADSGFSPSSDTAQQTSCANHTHCGGLQDITVYDVDEISEMFAINCHVFCNTFDDI